MTAQEMRRIYKSRSNRMIAGVCGGVAEYFNIDPSIVRVLWVLSVFLGGTGILLYIIAMIVIPSDRTSEKADQPSPGGARVWGYVLLIVGLFLLLENLDLLRFFHWWGPFSWRLAMAVILVAVGTLLLTSFFRKTPAHAPEEAGAPAGSGPPPQERRRLNRSAHDRKLFGVCGGIAEYFDIDSTIVRLLFAVVTLSSFGFGVLAYVLFAFIMPERRLGTTPA